MPLGVIKSQGAILSHQKYQIMNIHTMKKQLEIVKAVQPKQSVTNMFFQLYIDLDNVKYDEIVMMPYMSLIGNNIFVINLSYDKSVDHYFQHTKNTKTKLVRYSQWYICKHIWRDIPSFLDKIPELYRQYIPACYDGIWETNIWIRYLTYFQISPTTKNVITLVYFLSKQLSSFAFSKINGTNIPQNVQDYYYLFRTVTKFLSPKYQFLVHLNNKLYFEDINYISDEVKTIIHKYNLEKIFDSKQLINRKLNNIIEKFSYTDLLNKLPPKYKCVNKIRGNFLNDLEFMSFYISMHHTIGLTHIYYVDASSSCDYLKTLILELPYSYIWHLYDKNAFSDDIIEMSKKYPNNIILSKEFDLNVAKSIKETKRPFANSVLIFNKEISKNMEPDLYTDYMKMVMLSYRVIDPELCSIRFDIPVKYVQSFEIPNGIFVSSLYNDYNTTETRLILNRAADFNYVNVKDYEMRCQYHNCYVRYKSYKNVLSNIPSDDKFGLNNLYDSCAELKIIHSWLKNSSVSINISDIYLFLDNVMAKNKNLDIKNICSVDDKDFTSFYDIIEKNVINSENKLQLSMVSNSTDEIQKLLHL